MKAIGCLILFAALFNSTIAQPVSHQSIEDSVIGWMKVYHFKGTKESKKVDHRIYSAAQLSLCDTFANWIQASYMPKGGLGDVKRSVGEQLNPYNQYTAAKPQIYGAYSKTYIELKYNSSHKLEPFTNSHVTWSVYANNIPGDWPIRDLCTPEQYYFTLPNAETEEDDEKIKKLLDLSEEESIKPFITFWIKNTGYGGGKENVLLCKDNISPFVIVTKGEYILAIESALTRKYEAEKNEIYEQNKGNQKSIDYFMSYLNEKNDKRVACLNNNKEKYKNRLLETAEVFGAQPDIMLENYPDIFEGNGYNSVKFPVYKVNPEMAELCKKDKPQWILISWDYYVYDPTEKQQHEAIINNFNFGYVYSFFFEPEKVKGQHYKPLRSPLYKEKVILTEASANSIKNNTDKNVFFFEDFSTSAIGKTPVGWRTEYGLDGGIVVQPDGLNGNWFLITANTVTPRQLKTPLPQNFTVSFDLVASQNFTWGAKRIHFKLAKETSPGNVESFLDFGFRPGFDGRDGEVSLETKFPSPPGYANFANGFVAPGFSNNKKNNQIRITIKKMDETLQLFIDDNKITEIEKAIPAAHLFNAMSFFSYNSGENDKYYISNIQITKL